MKLWMMATILTICGAMVFTPCSSLMSRAGYQYDYMTNRPEIEKLYNYNMGYEQCDFHKLTGWGNWLNTNQQHLFGNPEAGGGGKLE